MLFKLRALSYNPSLCAGCWTLWTGQGARGHQHVPQLTELRVTPGLGIHPESYHLPTMMLMAKAWESALPRLRLPSPTR